MGQQSDRSQNDKLGNDYFNELIKPVEEPDISPEDIQNEYIKHEDSRGVKIFTYVAAGLLFLAAAIVIVSVVARIFIWGFNLG